MPFIPDRYLWLSLGKHSLPLPSTHPQLTPPGLLTALLTTHVSTSLRTLLRLTTITTPLAPPPTAPSPTAQENAIKTSALLTLATCPNTDIRASATTILCARFYANPSARKLLRRDLASRDADTRRTAQIAFRLLADHGVLRDAPPEREMDGWHVRDAGEGEGDGDGDERELRRRRREAVVFHDGGSPVSQGDVFMRGGGEAWA
jgi:hypothetical protein